MASTPAKAAEVNTNFTNLVTFLNNSVIHKDGSKAFTGNVDAGSNKIVNLTAGAASGDAVNYSQVSGAISFVDNVKAAYVAASELTTSTSYVDLTTPGPSVSCVTGTSALVVMSAFMESTTSSGYVYMGFAVSGATTLAADNARSIINYDVSSAAPTGSTASGIVLVTGLTAGTNVFTAKYAVASGVTGSFVYRTLAVIPLT